MQISLHHIKSNTSLVIICLFIQLFVYFFICLFSSSFLCSSSFDHQLFLFIYPLLYFSLQVWSMTVLAPLFRSLSQPANLIATQLAQLLAQLLATNFLSIQLKIIFAFMVKILTDVNFIIAENTFTYLHTMHSQEHFLETGSLEMISICVFFFSAILVLGQNRTWFFM